MFVRNRVEQDRARAAVTRTGLESFDLSDRNEALAGHTPVGKLHLAKGLEFKTVTVMAYDDVPPMRARVEAVADEVKLDEV